MALRLKLLNIDGDLVTNLSIQRFTAPIITDSKDKAVKYSKNQEADNRFQLEFTLPPEKDVPF
jgi:hypothetical protein